MSTSNPFMRYAAKSKQQNIGGWLQTKKTGRDDKKIAKDRKKAMLARRSMKSAARKSKKTSRKTKKKSRKIESDTDDDNNSLDSFIVGDDDEIEEIEASESEEEELIFSKPSKRKGTNSLSKKKTESKTRRKIEDIEDSEDEPAIKKIDNKYKNPFDDDSSSSELDEPVFKRPKNTNFVSSMSSKIRSPYFLASEEKKEESVHIQENETYSEDEADESDDIALQLALKKSRKEAKSSNKERVRVKEKKIYSIDVGESDDIALQRALKKSRKEAKNSNKRSKSKKPKMQEFIRSNEDQDLKDAIACSLKDAGKSKPKTSKQRHILESDSESENISFQRIYKKEPIEESESEDDVEDEYEDLGSKEATSVLVTTKDLSQEILSKMSHWCIDTKSAKDGANTGNTGMIIDGALSHSTCSGERHKLIVQREDIEKTCAGLKLGDYQLLGVNWLALLNGMKCSITSKEKTDSVNGVLADEMGLGKTVQTIAFLSWLKSTKKNTKNNLHIIIVPASVLSNWQNEFGKFCPDMKVVKYHGSMNERLEIQNELRQSLPTAKNPLPLDVILTTFSYFSSEKEDDRRFLRKFNFDYMVVDEAHCLKNAKGLRYRNMDKFSTQHRLLLTGTPVQNSPKELMNLLCFLMPLFSSPSFDNNSRNLGGAHMIDHFVSMNDSVDEENQYKKLKQLLSPFVLRRKKSDVLNQLLPTKTRKVEFVPFDDKTRTVYNSILSSHAKNRENRSEETSFFAYQNIFTSLRKAANHPLLLRTRHTSPEAIEHLSTQLKTSGYFGTDATCTLKLVKNELKKFSDYDIHCAALELIGENPLRAKDLERYTLEQNALFDSPKFARLRTLLPELVANNHRILIFSQWTMCLDLLECLMGAIEFNYLRLDGQTSIPERQNLIDQFNNDSSIPVFLLSTRAGGMGINLTSADTCILHDLDFNPFNDLQAEDRCHRIGQKKPVTVIKMVTSETVDASIYAMQEKKAKMNAAILENNNSSSQKKGKAKQDTAAINTMVQDAMSQFLSSSPKRKSRGN